MEKIDNLSDYSGGAKCIYHGMLAGATIWGLAAGLLSGAIQECWNDKH